jgi:DNA-binding LacI/PurR family transcriptional regulator
MMLITANLVTSGVKIFATTETVITATLDPLDQMTKIASSPERHSFQKEGYVKRCEEKGEEPDPDYVKMYETYKEQDEKNLVDLAWQKKQEKPSILNCRNNKVFVEKINFAKVHKNFYFEQK